jgi:outer membrane protein assembly factor BamB
MRSTIGIIVLSIYFAGTIEAQDGTRWRGPEATGVYPETGLMETWPDNGPQILWHYDGLGQGFSSPVFAGGKIYLSGLDQNTGYIYCLSMDGKLLWKKSYGPEWTSSYTGSRSSPKVSGGKIYLLSATGRLVCMDAANGNMIWSKDLLKDFDGRNITWGMTENVVVFDNKVLCTPGGTKNNVVALNKDNGSLIWSSKGKGEPSAYCSPILVKLPGRTLFVTITENNIIGLDANTGVLLWSYPHTNQYSVHANTPIFSGGELYCFSGYGRGGVKLKLSSDGSSVTKVWTNGTMDSRIGGAVFYNGFIYGSGDQNRAWQCIDWQTGKMKYSSVEVGKGSIIGADGKLFCYSEQGELALLKPQAEEFEVMGRTKVTLGSGTHWAHPVIFEGKLYIRHGNVLIAYKVK